MRTKLFLSCAVAVGVSALSVIGGGTPSCHHETSCWMTGGGTIGDDPGQPDYSFGGVVYPGCSPNAADGGNLNVVNHAGGQHFKGLHIEVVNCSGVPTRSPKVLVNRIDFTGVGTLTDDTTGNTEVVTFEGYAIDNHDGGAGADFLHLDVGSGELVIDSLLATGNIQIHTTSCGK